MIFHICLVFVLLFDVSVALQISTTEPFYREGEVQGDNSTEAFAQFMLDKPKVIASGFLVTDTFAAEDNRWIRAQILPIGVCFKEGSQNGSASIVQILIGSYSILRVTNVYTGSNCEGSYSLILLKVPFTKIVNNFEHIVRHEASMETALNFITPTYALIFTSYYSSDGCTGEAAQYDVVSIEKYTLYDDPIGTCGLFYINNENVMVLQQFNSNHGHGEIHPFCTDDVNPSDDGFSFPYLTNKQPFICTEERSNGSGKQVNYPLFQTIRSVFPTLDNTQPDSTPELPE